ncbi:MAG: flotillin-like FloA family protein [Bacteroidales bacterium]|nr:flotillin-like FloA family protein [Bacteroidales bacterium]
MIIVAVVISAAFIILPIPHWVMARIQGAKITFMEAMMMSFRRIKARKILSAVSLAVSANIDISAEELEKHTVEGGDVKKVVLTLIIVKKKGHQLYKNDVFESDFKGTILKDFSDFS